MICPICSDSSKHPCILPCNHTFCYLCIKQYVNVALKQHEIMFSCPICRASTNRNVLYDRSTTHTETSESFSDAWKYEARSGGWWYFSSEHSALLSEAHLSNNMNTTLNILGITYQIDFSKMIQTHPSGSTRRIMQPSGQNSSNVDVLGVCGLNFEAKIRK